MKKISILLAIIVMIAMVMLLIFTVYGNATAVILLALGFLGTSSLAMSLSA